MNIKTFMTDGRAVSATEFAIIAPILAFVALGMIDGWSLASTALEMRNAVQAGAKYVIEGGLNESEIKQVALAAWANPPRDGQVTVQRACFCEGASTDCTGLCETTSKPPVTYFNIQAAGTWTAPVDVHFQPLSRTLTERQSIRVR